MQIGQNAPADKPGRERLPNRRGNISFGFEFEGHQYRATAGRFADGRLAEIFLHVPGKLGTPMQANADNVAVLTSLALQHGVAPDDIRHSVTGPIAVALDLVAEMERTP
jgi:ribonucleoside-diphosphate reductase alpha chain